MGRGWVALALLLAGAAAVAGEGGDDPDLMIAKGHFLRGQALYQAGDAAGALREFTAAHDTKPVPEFLFNISVCDEKLGRLRDAIAALRGYLAGQVDPRVLADGRAHIAALERRLTPPPAPTARVEPPARLEPPAPAPTPPPRPLDRTLVAPAAVAGAALAVAAVGAGLIGSVAADYPDLSAAWDRAPSPALVSQANDLALRADLGYAFLAVAGALAVVDVVLWALRGRGEPRRASRETWSF